MAEWLYQGVDIHVLVRQRRCEGVAKLMHQRPFRALAIDSSAAVGTLDGVLNSRAGDALTVRPTNSASVARSFRDDESVGEERTYPPPGSLEARLEVVREDVYECHLCSEHSLVVSLAVHSDRLGSTGVVNIAQVAEIHHDEF